MKRLSGEVVELKQHLEHYDRVQELTQMLQESHRCRPAHEPMGAAKGGSPGTGGHRGSASPGLKASLGTPVNIPLLMESEALLRLQCRRCGS